MSRILEMLVEAAVNLMGELTTGKLIDRIKDPNLLAVVRSKVQMLRRILDMIDHAIATIEKGTP